MRAGFSITLMLAVCAMPVAAQETAQNAPVAKAAKPAKAKRVCRRDADLGTRIARSTCRSAEEWEQIDQAGRREAQGLIDRTSAQASMAGAAAAGQ